jgi:glucose/arabinose dehydrogenase
MMILTAMLIAASCGGVAPPSPPAWLGEVEMRPGYRVALAARDVPGVRHVETDGANRVFVSRPYAPPAEGERRSTRGEILTLRDRDGDGFLEWRETLVSGPVTLHGLCWVPDEPTPDKPVLPGAGWLWYATSGGVWKARDADGDGKAEENIEILKEGTLPSGGANWWRSVLVADIGGTPRILTGIGDTANITAEPESERQAVWSFSLDGTDKRLFVSGLRSTEKLRVRPGTDHVWGVDQGSDWFGRTLGEKPGAGGTGQPFTEAFPPDEINRYVEGGFYGHPYLVGDRVPRPEFAAKSDLAEWAAKTIAPETTLAPHAGAAGFCFLDPAIEARVAGRPTALPAELARASAGTDMIVACHGSWSTAAPAGYSLERVLFDPVTGKPLGTVMILRGVKRAADGTWTPLVRPVDVTHAADGSLLFTCDMNGVLLRVTGTPIAPPKVR